MALSIRYGLAFGVAAATMIVGCAMNSRILQMDATQIRAASDDEICGTTACTGNVTAAMQAEMARRYPAGLRACQNITYTCTSSDIGQRTPGTTSIPVSAQANGPVSERVAQQQIVIPRGGPTITNSRDPACEGISIVEVGIGLYDNVPGVDGVFVKVRTTSAQRKWIVADIKYYAEVHTALQNTAHEYWDTTKPLIMRPGDGVGTFWVRSLQGGGESNLRIVAVNVVSCGT
jgi:hypothetical protein